ncbi:early nodulin-like protein 1 [Macadamia integrifolia]|uniref:early nodulin-like protein 1 n=1 Tax=Macadamia integrifolia TaxID=60698 RepID=UPI001C4EBD18|nr:early nodulin-like protein 1 [Macadamia integrifolia]
MGSLLLSSAKAIPIIFFVILSSTLQNFTVSSFEFEVGGAKGWVVPPANGTNIYNEWATRNRFQIGDSVRFKYEKDSVMVVSGTEYKKCDSTHPMFFSNDGNTVYQFDRSGFYYFISGVSGHCKRGQKVIIRVMSPDDDDESSQSSEGASVHAITSGLSALLLLSFTGFYLL